MKPFAERPYRRGVGVVLFNRSGAVFVGRRIDTPDAWQMPQGGLDEGEAPAVAARRELREEIGTDRVVIIAESGRWLNYDLPPALADRVWRGCYRGQSQKWFAVRFEGTDADIDLATEHPEFDAWRWVEPADLPEIIVPFKRAVYDQVLVEFGEVLRLTNA